MDRRWLSISSCHENITQPCCCCFAAAAVFLFGCQLAGTPHEPHLRLLEMFAYGTYADAQAKADQLPKLTDAQVPHTPPHSIGGLGGS